MTATARRITAVAPSSLSFATYMLKYLASLSLMYTSLSPIILLWISGICSFIAVFKAVIVARFLRSRVTSPGVSSCDAFCPIACSNLPNLALNPANFRGPVSRTASVRLWSVRSHGWSISKIGTPILWAARKPATISPPILQSHRHPLLLGLLYLFADYSRYQPVDQRSDGVPQISELCSDERDGLKPFGTHCQAAADINRLNLTLFLCRR